MAMQIGAASQRSFFEKLGLFSTPSLEISEVGAPIFPKQWTETTAKSAAYGYGISITPLQLVTAIAGIVNKGMMQIPTLLKADISKSQTGNVVSENVRNNAQINVYDRCKEEKGSSKGYGVEERRVRPI
jgi:cell division protein FtsI (penicillin-binding protein 3)